MQQTVGEEHQSAPGQITSAALEYHQLIRQKGDATNECMDNAAKRVNVSCGSWPFSPPLFRRSVWWGEALPEGFE